MTICLSIILYTALREKQKHGLHGCFIGCVLKQQQQSQAEGESV